MLTRMLASFCLCTLAATASAADAPREMLLGAKRVVFLGDSITYAGLQFAYLDAWLLTLPAAERPQIINIGLPSETVSGLSEEGHAGGKFPRPDLAERLGRVLDVAQPDLVIACYGMNCAIYEPFDAGRFAKYQAGIKQLKEQTEKAGAKLIVVTPPFYDDQQAPKKFSYNEVLDKYSAWLLTLREEGWTVIDLHTPMTRDIRKRREQEPKFTIQPDGVHPSEPGYWVVAQQLLRAFGEEQAAESATPAALLEHLQLPPEALPLLVQRMQILRDAYLGAAGHKRPGVAPGLPIAEAEKKAAELTAKIEELRAKK